MIKQVISEIKQQLQCVNIIDYQINEYQLQKLYDGMIDQSMHPEDYFPYFVSYGLLLLHLDTHNQLLDSSNEESDILKFTMSSFKKLTLSSFSLLNLAYSATSFSFSNLSRALSS